MRRVRGSAVGKIAQVAGNEKTLLALIVSHVDKHLLETIAAADDTVDQTRHLIALMKIWTTGTVAQPFQNHPRTVLDIARSGSFGDLARAFSCAALLSVACGGDVDGSPAALADTIGQLILGLKALPFQTDHAARNLLDALPVSKMLAAERVLLESGKIWFALRSDARGGDIQESMEQISFFTRKHFEAMSKHWGLSADELALPDMTVLDVDRETWLQIASSMCDMEFNELDRKLAGKVGIHAELLRRAFT